MSIPGFATPEQTQQYAGKFHSQYAAGAYRKLGRSGLRVSGLGFGTYRCHAEEPAHKSALQRALANGCNIIDTSANYTDGMAEVLIGDVLNEEIVWNGHPREQFVIVSKAGYIQGENYDIALAREAAETPFPEVVKYQGGLWHCIHPVFLEDQLTRSLSRMHLDTLDIYLLHNPEYFLMHARRQGFDPGLAEKQFYNRLRRAFTALEKLVKDGLIRWYGISSNSFPLPAEHPHHVSLAKVWAAYGDACLQLGLAPEQGHFAVIQLPFNWLEQEAATLKNNEFHGQSFSVLELARQLKLGVLANRPLNAIKDDRLYRLARYGANPDQNYREQFREEIAKLQELEDQLTAVAAVTPFDREVDENALREFLGMSEQLSRLSRHPLDITSFPAVVNYRLAPVVAGVKRALENYAAKTENAPLRSLVQQYCRQFEAAANTWRLALDAQNFAALAPLNAEFDRRFPERAGLNFSQKALLTAAAPGVDVVLTGMRTPAYVEDALKTLTFL